jgi:hypothetical protein
MAFAVLQVVCPHDSPGPCAYSRPAPVAFCMTESAMFARGAKLFSFAHSEYLRMGHSSSQLLWVWLLRRPGATPPQRTRLDCQIDKHGWFGRHFRQTLAGCRDKGTTKYPTMGRCAKVCGVVRTKTVGFTVLSVGGNDFLESGSATQPNKITPPRAIVRRLKVITSFILSRLMP